MIKMFRSDVDTGGAGTVDVDAVASEVAAAAPADTAPAEPAANVEQVAAPEAAPSFFTHGSHSFADAAALTQHMDRGTLNKSDYDNKVRQLTERERQFTDREREWQGQSGEYQQRADNYSRLEQHLASNPEAANWLRQVVGQQGQAAPQGQGGDFQAMREQIQQDLAEEYGPIRDWYEQQQEQERLSGAIAEAGQQFGQGYNSRSVQDSIEFVRDAPEEKRLEALALVLGRAYAGQDVAAATLGSQRPEAQAPGVQRPGAGGGVPPSVPGGPAGETLDDVAARAKKELASGMFKI